MHSQNIAEIERVENESTISQNKPNGVISIQKENHERHNEIHRQNTHITSLDSGRNISKSLSGLFDTPTRERRESNWGNHLFGETSPRHD